VRYSGDFQKFNTFQSFAWDSFEKGTEIHLQGAPSQAELMYRDFKDKKENLTKKNQQAILEKYVGKNSDQLKAEEDRKLMFAQTEEYVEYTPTGQPLKEVPTGKNLIPKSKYEEDIHLHNHTHIWGSYWDEGKWGYACCRQFVKNSYCTGQAGIEVVKQLKEDEMRRLESSLNASSAKAAAEFAKPAAATPKKKKEKSLEEALKEEDSKVVEKDDRKRGYNSLHGDINVSDQEMEAYLLKKKKFEDPMKSFV